MIRSEAPGRPVAGPESSVGQPGVLMDRVDEGVRPIAAERDVKSSVRSIAWEVLQTVLLTLFIFFAVRSVVQNFRVEGSSMDPTLQTGQYLLINKVVYLRVDRLPLVSLLAPAAAENGPSYVLGGPKRGDIIVFEAPYQSDKDYIKRVIALPGETVRIDRGKVYVDGKPLDEPYVKHLAAYDFPPNGQPIVVPPGQYFVLGDNRPNSSDSHLGWFVPADHIVGKAWLSYWPPSQWGIVPGPAYAS